MLREVNIGKHKGQPGDLSYLMELQFSPRHVHCDRLHCNEFLQMMMTICRMYRWNHGITWLNCNQGGHSIVTNNIMASS
jgi:hypothetical protein